MTNEGLILYTESIKAVGAKPQLCYNRIRAINNFVLMRLQ